MLRIVELELWSAPGSLTTPVDGKQVAEQCMRATSLPADVVLGLSFIPGDTDVEILKMLIAEGVTTKDHFEVYCQGAHLSAMPLSSESAARFIASVEGSSLAWLHFPASPDGREMALQVHRWASNAGYIVRKCQGEPALSELQVAALWQH